VPLIRRSLPNGLFEQILVDVQARVETSSTAATPSSAELDDGSERYSAGFRSDDWSGTLTAANIESGSEQWNAEEVLRNQADRRLFTFDGTQGVSLDYDELSPDQQDALGFNQADENDGLAVQRIEWLRGSTASTELRGRSTEDGPRLLGDIVNSDPQLDRKQNYGYAVLPEGDDGAYAGYRGVMTTRTARGRSMQVPTTVSCMPLTAMMVRSCLVICLATCLRRKTVCLMPGSVL